MRKTLISRDSDKTASYRFSVELRLHPEGPSVTREPVSVSDLIPLFSELWQEQYLRRGKTDVALADIDFRLLPVYGSGEPPLCVGLHLESHGPNGYHRQWFDIASMEHVARRGEKGLLKDGVLQPGTTCVWCILAENSGVKSFLNVHDRKNGSAANVIRTKPLDVCRLPLGAILDRASAVEDVDSWVPVIYSREAHNMAERYARQGGARRPPIESGAMMLGMPCTCPETGTFFVLVTEAVELIGTTETATTFSLTYSARTWRHIQQTMTARQRRPAGRCTAIVGQAHGHNFIPQAQTHEAFHTKKPMTAATSSVFVSEDDLTWSRAVFSHKPWAFCQIFGYSVDAKPRQGLFGFRGGKLVRRGYHIAEIGGGIRGDNT